MPAIDFMNSQGTAPYSHIVEITGISTFKKCRGVWSVSGAEWRMTFADGATVDLTLTGQTIYPFSITKVTNVSAGAPASDTLYVLY